MVVEWTRSVLVSLTWTCSSMPFTLNGNGAFFWCREAPCAQIVTLSHDQRRWLLLQRKSPWQSTKENLSFLGASCELTVLSHNVTNSITNDVVGCITPLITHRTSHNKFLSTRVEFENLFGQFHHISRVCETTMRTCVHRTVNTP